ncbi:MAG TPA: sigma-70 family RNA polymerase sigma factor [Cellulomonas sp.]
MSTITPPDLAQLCGLIGQDADALEAVYRAHVRDVELFVARRVRDPFVVADLTADVFVRAVESADGYRPEAGRPVAWLLGIARHVIAAHHRAVRRADEATRRIDGRALVDADAYERLHEQIDAATRARRLYDDLAALPDGLRDVLELVVVDDLPLTEVAEVLGISPGAARVRLHRARLRLRRASTEPLED